MINLCRVCMCLVDETSKYLSIFESKEQSDIALMIFLISGVQIIECKEIPALICHDCIFVLRKADKLRRMILKTDEYFRSLIPKEFYCLGKSWDQSEDAEIEIEALEEETTDNYVLTKVEPVRNEQLGTSQEIPRVPNKRQKGKRSSGRKKNLIKSKFHCSKCINSYTTFRRLKHHEYTRHLEISQEALLICDLCNFKSKTKELIRRHINRVHSSSYRNRELFICKICGRSSSSKSNLNTHMKTHIRVDPSNYVHCTVCLKGFKDQSFMLTHRKLVHDRIRTIKCPECPHVASCKATFNKHFKAIHLKLKDLLCSYCGVGFARRDTLNRHITIHTGERSHACRHKGCTKAYSSCKGRIIHMRVCPYRNQPQMTSA